MFARWFALSLILLLPDLAQAAGFLSVYEDLPLPSTLTEVAGSAFSFDSQDGRIAEVEAKGAMDQAAVLQFYATALPQLGWTQDGPTQFHRDQEILRFETAEAGKGGIIVRFKVSPN